MRRVSVSAMDRMNAVVDGITYVGCIGVAVYLLGAYVGWWPL